MNSELVLQSRRTSERSTVDDEFEDPEAADFRFAQMLAERDGVGPDETLDLEAATFEAPEGDSRDFLWGFLLASLFGYIMVMHNLHVCLHIQLLTFEFSERSFSCGNQESLDAYGSAFSVE